MTCLKQIWRSRSSFDITARLGPMPRGTVLRTAALLLLPDNVTIAVTARLRTPPLLPGNATIAVTARLSVIRPLSFGAESESAKASASTYKPVGSYFVDPSAWSRASACLGFQSFQFGIEFEILRLGLPSVAVSVFVSSRSRDSRSCAAACLATSGF